MLVIGNRIKSSIEQPDGLLGPINSLPNPAIRAFLAELDQNVITPGKLSCDYAEVFAGSIIKSESSGSLEWIHMTHCFFQVPR